LLSDTSSGLNTFDPLAMVASSSAALCNQSGRPAFPIPGEQLVEPRGWVTVDPAEHTLPDREELWFVEEHDHYGAEVSQCRQRAGKAFLRLSLVSCPIYLSPATTRTKSIRLHQVWQPKDRCGAPIGDEEEDEQPSQPAARSFNEDFDDTRLDPPAPTRVALRPQGSCAHNSSAPW
jgi:hypothetical protein